MYSRIALKTGEFVQPMIALKPFTPKSTSDNLKSWIEDTLKEFNFDLSKCVNLTADGTSNDQGIDNGLVKQLTEDIES